MPKTDNFIDAAIENLGCALAEGLVSVHHGPDVNVTDGLFAIAQNLISPNEADSNLEAANVVDGLFAIARGLHSVADALRSRTEENDDGPEILPR